jgi:hypothetical protein
LASFAAPGSAKLIACEFSVHINCTVYSNMLQGSTCLNTNVLNVHKMTWEKQLN